MGWCPKNQNSLTRQISISKNDKKKQLATLANVTFDH
jgi:hypothetical protein